MMKAYEASKGVGWGKLPDPPTAAPAMNLNTKEEYDAYLKWCEENKAKLAEQQKQQELLDAWRAREAKHKYYEMVVFEQLRFCRCSDFTEDVGRYFNREEFHKYEEFDIDDLGLNAIQSQNVNDVANALNLLSEEDRIKQFFGGLGNALCEGARRYIEQVEDWEKQHNFMDNLS